MGVVYGDALPWNQALPVDPSAGQWKPLFLTRSTVNELAAVPPPPANNSAETKRDMEDHHGGQQPDLLYGFYRFQEWKSTSLVTGWPSSRHAYGAPWVVPTAHRASYGHPVHRDV